MKSTIRFRITALPLSSFVDLFTLDNAGLARHNARCLIADAKPGFPCRVSLVDAEVGERLILLPFMHHPVDSPYRASGPIYVREAAHQAIPEVNEVPEAVRRRLLSVRAYGHDGTMIGAEVAEGAELEVQIDRFFDITRVAYLHLHNARPGCYSCRVDRA